jgi:hypothetical protein
MDDARALHQIGQSTIASAHRPAMASAIKLAGEAISSHRARNTSSG